MDLEYMRIMGLSVVRISIHSYVVVIAISVRIW